VKSVRGVKVVAADPAGPAAARGLVAGSRLLRINGAPVRDELDLFYLSADPVLEIEYLDLRGRAHRASVVKACQTDLGVEIEPLRARRCRNRCIFCFIDQNPPGLRPSLYVKDEDFRLSFTHGHYITATSLCPGDLRRIVSQRLSPLYISVHATRHDLRRRMLGIFPRPTPDILETLRFLARGRIDFHTQIVLCPGWNDGEELERTLDDLEELLPSLLSVAVVPVGLTDHREGLEPIRRMTPTRARGVIDQIAPRQRRLRRRHGKRVVLLADEF
jgi:putative radical SAM enzyme (TIGR03279 family)